MTVFGKLPVDIKKMFTDRFVKASILLIVTAIFLFIKGSDGRCYYKNGTDAYGFYYQKYYCEETLNVGVIIGVVVAVVVVVGVIVGIFIYRRRMQQTGENSFLVRKS
ncbi:uncharacterized protein LOC134272815 [Saccostrea cucullata]|uniref:uncharacterized protein LOC134272815 n=1 Tax=Saccostrea cuccullata TaxID=36930 RepID=UPI002ED25CB5